MTIRWILVANASHAALYTTVSNARTIELHSRYEHPESRAKNTALSSDINGRKPGGGVSAAARPGADSTTEPKAVEHQRFARELASLLNSGRTQRAYDSLSICAPPHFLGLIRSLLSDEAGRVLDVTLNKDLTLLDQRALADVLHGAIQAAAPLG